MSDITDDILDSPCDNCGFLAAECECEESDFPQEDPPMPNETIDKLVEELMFALAASEEEYGTLVPAVANTLRSALLKVRTSALDDAVACVPEFDPLRSQRDDTRAQGFGDCRDIVLKGLRDLKDTNLTKEE